MYFELKKQVASKYPGIGQYDNPNITLQEINPASTKNSIEFAYDISITDASRYKVNSGKYNITITSSFIPPKIKLHKKSGFSKDFIIKNNNSNSIYNMVYNKELFARNIIDFIREQIDSYNRYPTYAKAEFIKSLLPILNKTSTVDGLFTDNKLSVELKSNFFNQVISANNKTGTLAIRITDTELDEKWVTDAVNFSKNEIIKMEQTMKKDAQKRINL